MFNEKVPHSIYIIPTVLVQIYLFLWWWFLLVGICTIFSFVYWLLLSTMRSQQNVFIDRYLHVYNLIKPEDPTDRRALARFVHRGLRPDGIFLLRMVSANAGDLITTDIVVELWKRFLTDVAAERPPPPKLIEKNAEFDEIDPGGGFRESLYPGGSDKQALTKR
jgi:hypothetical protein